MSENENLSPSKTQSKVNLNLIFLKIMTLSKILMTQFSESKEKISEVYQNQWHSNQLNQLKLLILYHKIIQNENKLKEQYFLKYQIEDLIMENNKWQIKNANSFESSTLEIRLGFLGNFNSGKTYLINQLFTIDLPLEHTKNIRNISLSLFSNLKIIDTPGLRNPLIKDENESKNKDFFIKQLILSNCNLVFYVVSSYDLNAQKEIEEIKRECLLANTNLIVIHNIFTIKSQEDYDNFFQSNLRLNNNIIQCSNAISEKKGNKEVIHFVYGHSSSFFNFIEIIERIKQQIQVTKGVRFMSFKNMINKTISTTIDFIYEGIKEKDKTNCSKDTVLIITQGAKLRKFNKNLNKIQSNIPRYGYYINNNDTLVIELEMINISNLKIKIDVIGEHTTFKIIADKNIERNEYLECSMWSGKYDFEIKIPLTQAVLSNKTVKNKSNNNGMIKLEFSLLTNSKE